MSRWEELNITEEELETMAEAFKQEEFRSLLIEFFDDVANPENQKKLQEEIISLERQRGYKITFVTPKPGYVVMTSFNGDQIAYINICQSSVVSKPTPAAPEETGRYRELWSLPHAQSKPRNNFNVYGELCTVYDVVFHPDIFEMLRKNEHFRDILNDTAIDSIEHTYNVTLDKNNIKSLSSTYEGVPHASIIREKIDAPLFPIRKEDAEILCKILPPVNDDETSTCAGHEKFESESEPIKVSDVFTTPKYEIKYRSYFDIQSCTKKKFDTRYPDYPKELIVDVYLPLLSSAKNVVLDVRRDEIHLICSQPVKYKLNVKLSFNVDEEEGSAKFLHESRQLRITLPVIYNSPFVHEEQEDSSNVGNKSTELIEDNDQNNEDLRNRNPNLYPDPNLHQAENDFLADLTRRVLKPNRLYTTPFATGYIVQDGAMITLHVRNVISSTIEYIFLVNSCGIQISFSSLGSGHFLNYHAFCVKFPFPSSLIQKSLNIEVWDNNVIVQVGLDTHNRILTHYYIGTKEDALIEQELPTARFRFPSRKEECTFIIEEEIHSEGDEMETAEEDVERVTSSKEAVQKSGISFSTEALTIDVPQRPHDEFGKDHIGSESSSDDTSSSGRKGILKVSPRSLSESDDYCGSSYEDEGIRKKTVRFNEVVAQKTFRANSSILGQRKKNQRKTRNKKRAQEIRRASESETSDWELEKEKEKVKERKKERDYTKTETSGNDLADDEDSERHSTTSFDFVECVHGTSLESESFTELDDSRTIDTDSVFEKEEPSFHPVVIWERKLNHIHHITEMMFELDLS